MDTTRRSFLRLGTAIAGATALAGCTGSLNGETNEAEDRPAALPWLYDPTTLLDVENHGFGTINVEALYENRNRLPDELFEAIDELDEEFENADVVAFEHLTATGFVSSDLDRGGGTLVAAGSFDADAIRAELEAEFNEAVGDDETWSYEGYDGYHVEEPYRPMWGEADEEDRYASLTLGLDEEHVLLGFALDETLRSDRALEAAIDTHDGGESPYYDDEESVRSLVDQIGDAIVGFGVDVDDQFVAEAYEDADEEYRELLRDLTAFGLSTDVVEDAVETRFILVYAAEDAASTDTLEALVETLRDDPEFDRAVGEIDVERDGRSVVVTSAVDADEFWEQFSDPFAGEATPDFDGDEAEAVPGVVIDAEYDHSAETLTLVHVAGDHLDGDAVRLEGDVEAETVPGWEAEVTVGDSTEPIELEPGEHLEVVWEDPDSGDSRVLFYYAVPA